VSSLSRLTKEKVWVYALDLLLKFQLRFGKIESPPVPLDDILRFLGLELEFDDISARFGVSGHLGCTICESRQIFIDQSLDKTDHPEFEGRLNFTIAHEIAHWYLHRHIADPYLLSHDDKPWLERQADWFASFLLMPTGLVRKAWKTQVGHAAALTITPEEEAIAIANLGSRAAYIVALADQYASQLAPLFKVSRDDPARVFIFRILKILDEGSIPNCSEIVYGP
jgi:hypothetical protein